MQYIGLILSISFICWSQAMVVPQMRDMQLQTPYNNSVQENKILSESASNSLNDAMCVVGRNKKLALMEIPGSNLGQLIQNNDVATIKQKCEGSWLRKIFIPAEDLQRRIVFGLFYASSLKFEQSGKVVDYLVDKVKADRGCMDFFLEEIEDDSIYFNSFENCHKKLLGLLMEKRPKRTMKVYASLKGPLECHTRLLNIFRRYLPDHYRIPEDVVLLFNKYEFDEQLIRALMPMAYLPIVKNVPIIYNLTEVKKLRALNDTDLCSEVQRMLNDIDAVLDGFLKVVAKRLLVEYLYSGLRESIEKE